MHLQGKEIIVNIKWSIYEMNSITICLAIKKNLRWCSRLYDKLLIIFKAKLFQLTSFVSSVTLDVCSQCIHKFQIN